MSHQHAHRNNPWQDSWGYHEFDDCPPRQVARTAVYQPHVRPRLTVGLPPCKPQAGIKTDWGGNTCAALRNTSEAVADENFGAVTPQVGPEEPKTQQPASQLTTQTGTARQERTSDDDHPSTYRTIDIYLAIAVLLALSIIVIRRVVLVSDEVRIFPREEPTALSRFTSDASGGFLAAYDP